MYYNMFKLRANGQFSPWLCTSLLQRSL